MVLDRNIQQFLHNAVILVTFQIYMNERDADCEESCFYFATLSPKEKILNRKARWVTRKGEEFPGLLNTLCGGCIKIKIINSCLDKKIRKILNHQN